MTSGAKARVLLSFVRRGEEPRPFKPARSYAMNFRDTPLVVSRKYPL